MSWTESLLSLGAVPPFFFDFDSLSNIDVVTGGADPSLATPGVTLSLVTKRGTNVVRGSARALDTSGVGWDYGVEAGGPLWRDRVWLWAAFAHNDYLTEPFLLGSGEVLRSSVTLANWNAKLNAELLPANTLTLAYTNFDRTTLGWLLDPGRSDDSNSNNARPGQSYIVQDAHVFSDRLFASLNLSYVTNASANIAARRLRPAGHRGRGRHLAPQFLEPLRRGRQAPGRPERLGILRHGPGAARAEGRVRLPARHVRLGVELAR